MSKKIIFIQILIATDLLFLILIIVLSIKIIPKIKNVLGVQHVTRIDKTKVTFPSEKHTLKFFWEPLQNSEDIAYPDWLGHKVSKKINSDTLNEQKEYNPIKQNGVYRIVSIGDSFTYGFIVDNDQSYPRVLEKLINTKLVCPTIKSFEVINLGVVGYDINYTVERFIKRGIKYEPDLTIWLINDWNLKQIKEWLLPVENEMLKNEKNSPQPLTGEQVSINAYDLFRKEHSMSTIWAFQKEQFERLFRSYAGKIVLATMGRPDLIYDRQLQVYQQEWQNITYFNDVFNTHQDDSTRFTDNHPNSIGYEKIAKSFFDYLRKNYFYNCSEVN